MRTKKVNLYHCDFCKNRGLSATSMAKHEKHCTMNPNRICRVCKMIEGVQVPIAELVALLPRLDDYPEANQFELGNKACEAIDAAIPKLRAACSNCPACILAALRQAKISVPLANGFNFTSEMKDVWADINEANREEYEAG